MCVGWGKKHKCCVGVEGRSTNVRVAEDWTVEASGKQHRWRKEINGPAG